MSKSKRPGSHLTPRNNNSKIKDTKKSPSIVDKEEISTCLTFENMDANTDQPSSVQSSEASTDEFISSLWPMLEKKLDHWMEHSFNKKVKEIATEAVDSYVSSEGFKEALHKSIGFDLSEAKSQQEEYMKERKSGKIQEKVINSKLDDIEQYSRRNNIRISGIPETDLRENTDNIVTDIVKNKIGIQISRNDICRSHRVGRKRDDKPRQIIVKLVRHNTKVAILRKRKDLNADESNNIKISEDLTKGRLAAIHLINTKAKECVQKLWTTDGVINVRKKKDPSNVITLRNLVDLDSFIVKISE